MSYKKWELHQKIDEVDLSSLNVEKIGTVLGVIGKVDDEFDVLKKDYLRVRVKFNVFKPLIDYLLIEGLEGSDLEVFYKYEHLRDLYYSCGIIGHLEHRCPLAREREVVKRKLGPWLKSTFTSWSTNDHHPKSINNGNRASSTNKGKMPMHIQSIDCKESFEEITNNS